MRCCALVVLAMLAGFVAAPVARAEDPNRNDEQVLLSVTIYEVNLTKMRALGFDFSPDLKLTSTPESLGDFLASLKVNNLAKVLAEPQLVTTLGRAASFNAGGEFPVPSAKPGEKVEFRPYGTRVDALTKPQGEDKLEINLRVRVSALDKSNSIVVDGVTVPAVRVRETEGVYALEYDEALLIQGTIQERFESITSAKGTEKRANEIQLITVVKAQRVE